MIDSSYIYTKDCVQGSNPPCTSVCPINFKTRDFLSKLQRGNFNGAYREYAKNVIFPGIVSKICNQNCHEICPEKISVLKLEAAVVRYADRKEPINYNLPGRKEKIAIIGGGLSGMACAHRLSTRRYNVTIFEREDSVGGSLKDLIDADDLNDEFELQFKYLNYTLETNQEIITLDDLDYDAVYIATGKHGNDFGLLKSWNSKSLGTSKKGVFLGGKVTGCNDMEALMDGMIAAASIEKYIKVGKMDGQADTYHDPSCKIPVEYNDNAQPIIPLNGEYYTKEEAVKEAKRCVLCDCTKCKDRCDFLQHMDLLPRKVESDAQMAKSADEGLFERVGTRMIVSCSVCGLCGAVCPEDINVEDILIESKKMLYESGHFPPPFHDFYLRDMMSALSEAYAVKAAPGYETATYMFFPGCQMTASGTEHVERAYGYMLKKNPDTALMLGCCGVPALWAGNQDLMKKVLDKLKNEWENLGKPILVSACPSCLKTFSNYADELECISIYEYIADRGLPENASSINGDWAVFDPCSSRNFPKMQTSVRNLSNRLGAELVELNSSGPEARCCGMGGHIYPANPEVFHKMLNSSINESELPYITYCMNCRNLFLSADKKCNHILDGVLGVKPLEKPFHISELRKNRIRLKKHLLKEIWGEDFEIEKKKYSVKLKISEEIYDKMDMLHISEEDVYDVVEHCIQSNEEILEPKTEIYTGYKQIGIFTYWVQYKKNDDNIEVVNTYVHRIQID